MSRAVLEGGREPAAAGRAARTPAPLRLLLLAEGPALAEVEEALAGDAACAVAGRAAGRAEALRLLAEVQADCVVLDLEAPRLEALALLRELVARRPIPVVALGRAARKAETFRALALGALDVVARADDAPLGATGRADLLTKLELVRALAQRRPGSDAAAAPTPAPTARAERSAPPSRLAVLGASTGGPAALARLFAAIPAGLPLAWAVAQHMPERFTGSFAERLARLSGLDVREARDGDALAEGRVLLAPGGHHLKLVRTSGPGSPVRAALLTPDPRDGPRWCPSVDLLFTSAAEAFGPRACAVVLTGMGSDGRLGVERVKANGGRAFAESEETAVVYGMPKEAADTGVVDEVLSLDDIAERLRRFAAEG